MIESCALFFALLWLALLTRYLATSQVLVLIISIVAGILAALVKSATFPAFLVAGSFSPSNFAA